MIHPLNHATMALRASDLVIYVDPVGGARFRGIPQPTLILITDIHDDHLSAETVNAVRTPHTVIVAPEAMQSELESGGETACARSAETYCRASFRPFRSTQS